MIIKLNENDGMMARNVQVGQRAVLQLSVWRKYRQDLTAIVKVRRHAAPSYAGYIFEVYEIQSISVRALGREPTPAEVSEFTADFVYGAQHSLPGAVVVVGCTTEDEE